MSESRAHHCTMAAARAQKEPGVIKFWGPRVPIFIMILGTLHEYGDPPVKFNELEESAVAMNLLGSAELIIVRKS